MLELDNLKIELNSPMEGIQFITDQLGKPTAVIIDLEQWGDFGKISMMF